MAEFYVIPGFGVPPDNKTGSLVIASLDVRADCTICGGHDSVVILYHEEDQRVVAMLCGDDLSLALKALTGIDFYKYYRMMMAQRQMRTKPLPRERVVILGPEKGRPIAGTDIQAGGDDGESPGARQGRKPRRKVNRNPRLGA